jgi:hypothetical protein
MEFMSRILRGKKFTLVAQRRKARTLKGLRHALSWQLSLRLGATSGNIYFLP